MEISLKQMAELLDGRLEGPPDRMISGLKGIEQAGPQDAAFLAHAKYVRYLDQCRAGVVLVKPDQETPRGLSLIRVENPQLAFAKLMTKALEKPLAPLGVHPRAVVEDSAKLGQDVSIHALAYVGPYAEVGDRVVIHPGTYLGSEVRVGDDTVIYPNVVIYQGCQVGRRCLIHAGTVIGADGFGFIPEGGSHFKVPQVGIVQIDDDVELGALNTVDRAAHDRTWIKRGVKTDNLVHIAHNCVIGEDSLLVAQAGISGSTRLGRHVVLGGQVGLGGHITLGDNVMVGGQSGVNKSVPAGEIVTGSPAIPHRIWLRAATLWKRLPELFERVAALESKSGEDNLGKGKD